ncbi:MAG: NUDIX domain-containing protein [Coriobacteriia bacterium]
MRQVAAAVIIEHDLLLLARRGPAEKLAGFWELPGGKLEPGETPQQCLERELLEELAMKAVAGDVLARAAYQYDHGSFEMLALDVERLSDYLPTVHDLVAWVSRDDLPALHIAPADVQLLDELLSRGIW